jgi:hypothetical protein
LNHAATLARAAQDVETRSNAVPGLQRVFMKRPERGIYAASCVIARKRREISWQPCDANAEAA